MFIVVFCVTKGATYMKKGGSGSYVFVILLLQDASNNDALQNEEVVKDPSPDELNKGAEEQKAENPNDMEPEQPQQEVTVSEEVMHKEAYEQQEQQILQVPLTNLEVDWEVPVHQGQPEI